MRRWYQNIEINNLNLVFEGELRNESKVKDANNVC